MKAMTRPNKGFTLAEILVVVTIIVVLGLAMLVGINPMAQIFKGYDARRKADLAKIKIALEAYYSDHDCYPVFPLNAQNRPSYVCDSDFLNPYLASMPCDPNSKKPYTLYLTPAASSCPQSFAVYAQIYSFFDKQANKIPLCPNTVGFTSSDMNLGEIIYGCSLQIPCPVVYGCVNYACAVVGEYGESSCKYDYCEPTCGGPIANNCAKLNRQCN